MRVLVVGMARSGIAVAKLLSDLGAQVRINDSKPETEFDGALEELRQPSIEWRLGERAEGLLDGVDMLVISPGIPIDHPVILEAQRRNIEVAGELELAYRYAKGMLVAITGTNGKTTTTTLVGEMFKNAGKRTFVVGNIGFPYSAVSAQTSAEDVVICEVSSFQLESISKYRPSIAAVLNISEDHLNRHHTMQKYIELKTRIFENQSAQDYVVLNYDDAEVRKMAQFAKGSVVWFSRIATPPMGAFVRDGNVVYGALHEHQVICAADEIGISGPHNLENALAATCMAMAGGLPVDVIRHTLKVFQGVEHRIEFVRELDGVRYINDSKATNIDSTLKAIAAMDRPTVILLGGSDKHVDMRQLCNTVSDSKMITHAVLMGEMAPQLEKYLTAAGFYAYEHAGYDFLKAIHMARAKACNGGNVLLSPACASFDMFKDFEHRGEEFKRIVNELEPEAR